MNDLIEWLVQFQNIELPNWSCLWAAAVVVFLPLAQWNGPLATKPLATYETLEQIGCDSKHLASSSCFAKWKLQRKEYEQIL